MTHALFWSYLGGTLAAALFAIESTEFSAHVRRGSYRIDAMSKDSRGPRSYRFFGHAAMYSMMIAIMFLWPLTLLSRLTIGGWVRDKLNQKFMFADVRCTVCGFSDRASAPKNAISWTSAPYGWFVNSNFELTCSPSCAHHFDHCPDHSKNTDLH